jgi:hypothetical protein
MLRNKLGHMSWAFLQQELAPHYRLLIAARLLQLLLILLARPLYYRHRVAISAALKALVCAYLGGESLRQGLHQTGMHSAAWLGVQGRLDGYTSLSRALMLPTGVYLSLFEVLEYFKMPFRL